MDKKSNAFVDLVSTMVKKTRMDERFWPWFARAVGDFSEAAPDEAKEIMRRAEDIYELQALASKAPADEE